MAKILPSEYLRTRYTFAKAPLPMTLRYSKSAVEILVYGSRTFSAGPGSLNSSKGSISSSVLF